MPTNHGARIVLIWSRRFRCKGCNACCAVGPPGVLPRHLYSLGAILTPGCPPSLDRLATVSTKWRSTPGRAVKTATWTVARTLPRPKHDVLGCADGGPSRAGRPPSQGLARAPNHGLDLEGSGSRPGAAPRLRRGWKRPRRARGAGHRRARFLGCRAVTEPRGPAHHRRPRSRIDHAGRPGGTHSKTTRPTTRAPTIDARLGARSAPAQYGSNRLKANAIELWSATRWPDGVLDQHALRQVAQWGPDPIGPPGPHRRNGSVRVATLVQGPTPAWTRIDRAKGVARTVARRLRHFGPLTTV